VEVEVSVREVEEMLRKAIEAAMARGVKLVPGLFVQTLLDGTPLACCAIGATLLDWDWHESGSYLNEFARRHGVTRTQAWDIANGFDFEGGFHAPVEAQKILDEEEENLYFNLGRSLRRDYVGE
jgi:hypothetical protein